MRLTKRTPAAPFVRLGRLTRTVGCTVLAGLVVAAAATSPARAEVKVASLVGDHMVVQRGQPVRLWGTAGPGESIAVTLADRYANTRADAVGRWVVVLPALGAGGPFQVDIVGTNRLTFHDVWVGEVWLASGQSNMEFPLTRSEGAEPALRTGCSGIHLFTVAHATAKQPLADVDGTWRVCDPPSAASFSAVAFHFARELHRALGVPVGVVHASWGGTPAEAWTPREALVANPALRSMVEDFDAALANPNLQAAAARAAAEWEAKNFYADTGNKGAARGFARPGLPKAGWSPIELPRFWEDAGLDIDGAVWFRREVDVPADWAGRDLALSLGPVDDFDVTYWNGTQVGAIGPETPDFWSVPRQYTIPARLVKAGRAVVAVRVFDHYGSGGFGGTAEHMVLAPVQPGPNDKPVSLAGAWLYKIERRLKPIVADWSTRPQVPGVTNPESPTVLWNAMTAPLTWFSFAGAIWYQGEQNVGRADEYRTLFPTMIRAWRAAWREPAMPFLFVQLPNFADPAHPSPPGTTDSPWAELREAQTAALELANTAMAVTIDVGEPGDIHPHDKYDVARRLALLALARVYRKPVLASGPAFHSAVRDGAAMRVRFDGLAGAGLVTLDGQPPRGFVIAGADGVWHPADAAIEGDTVRVWSGDVPEPVAVRYAWGNDPPNTLRNQADLPAAPFRSDRPRSPAPTSAAPSARAGAPRPAKAAP